MPNENPRLHYATFSSQNADAHAALLALGKSVKDGGLDQKLTELVKIRVSQKNGCAFCVQYHLDIARRLGVAPEKIDLVAAWRDAGIFTGRERAALAWAEALTDLETAGAPDYLYEELLGHFPKNEAVLLTIAIGLINNWNRIAVGLRFAPLLPDRAVA